jgi:hypothetical protein
MKKTALIVGFALLVLGGLREGAWAQSSKCDLDQYDYQSHTATGFEDSAFIWRGGGHLCQMMVANDSGSTVWAMWFDATALPSTGAIPKQQFPVLTGTSNGIFSWPTKFYNGVVLACSSTAGALTVTSSSDCSFTAKVVP